MVIYTRGGKAPVFDDRNYGTIVIGARMTAPEWRGEAKLADELEGFDMGGEAETEEIKDTTPAEKPKKKKSGNILVTVEFKPTDEVLRALRFKRDGSLFDKATQKDLREALTTIASTSCDRAVEGLLTAYREALKKQVGG